MSKCETCKHNNEPWYSEACDGCTRADSRYEQDLISRKDAVNEIHKYFVEEIDKTPVAKDEDGDTVYTDMPTVNSLLACNKELSKRIKALPSADRPTGRWVNRKGRSVAECDQCGRIGRRYMNYCSYCGARMLGEDGEV